MVHYEVVQYLMDCCGITYSRCTGSTQQRLGSLAGRSLYPQQQDVRVPKMQKIDLGNNESMVCGVFPNRDGTFTAMTYTKAKHLKPKLVRADGWRSTQ